MDIEPPNLYQVLSILQKKIAFLFQDLMREKSSYKEKSENLNIQLEQLSAEAKIIKRENEALKEIYSDMKSIIYSGIKLFKNSDFSGVKREHEIKLENLKKKLFDTDGKLKNFESSHISGTVGIENSFTYTKKCSEINMSRHAMNEAEIQKEFESLKELNFTTQFFDDNEADGKGQEKEYYALNKINGELVLKNLFERKPQNQCQVKNAVVMCETESSNPKHVDLSNFKAVQPSSVESHCNKSPVFKDFGNHKQDVTLGKEINIINSSSPPLKLINKNFMDESKNFSLSPWKVSSHVNKNSPVKGSSTPKLAKRRLDVTSPKRFPNAHLKKSNSREAEISISGVRKLTQTLLNIECLKKKNLEDWKSCENSENKHFGIADDVFKYETKLTVDTEEDDFIIESPKRTDQLTEDVISRNRNENVLRDVHLITPPETSDADLDETYISASIIRKCKLTKKHVIENATEEQKPLKKPAREKSPVSDSVPFMYKRDPLRKKIERMKLPGHACLDCNKYYENALGDVDTPNRKKILNKCSRHRDKNSPISDETPPGYWKAYLTCTGMTPPKEDRV